MALIPIAVLIGIADEFNPLMALSGADDDPLDGGCDRAHCDYHRSKDAPIVVVGRAATGSRSIRLCCRRRAERGGLSKLVPGGLPPARRALDSRPGGLTSQERAVSDGV